MNPAMNRSYFKYLLEGINHSVMSSLDGEVFWIESSGDGAHRFEELIPVFSA